MNGPDAATGGPSPFEALASREHLRVTVPEPGAWEKIMLRRLGLGSLLILATLLMPAPSARADEYPTRPIKLIITTPAGSLIDVLGRIIANDLGERLGQPVVIDNRPGAMTKLGA